MRSSRLRPRCVLASAAGVLLSGCATLGSMMSPYPETFSCKNDDHGQCIHPERAHADAVAGVVSKSEAEVTNDRKILRDQGNASRGGRHHKSAPDAFGSYRASLYHELKGLLEAPVTPMLKPARTVRTLVLPYADRQRPDRLYMPRYIYSILDKPVWVVGGTLVSAPSRAAQAPVLGQIQEPSAESAELQPSPQPEPHP
ncbi:MAG: TraV family lipoprotein [Sphingomonas sp.]|uniref:TraV family lipoprotein n=1 Tax=Sphingomonas sp. TaxID=28214 RepID=UPI0026358A27|nr:TraV family lipoprotein [Sphingomonas sp.]MDK2768432.1 TraV family lipoprotein [Sphingomonas sp.]